MEYEKLLDMAFSKVECCKECSRFKLVEPKIRYEGKKTIIENFLQLASCFERNIDHLARYLCKNLASFGEIEGERFIFGRKISEDLINKKIKTYFEEYVKCKNCEKPDTELVYEKEIMLIKCLACGCKYSVNKF